MKGLDKMLKPVLSMLEIAIPDAEPENDTSLLIQDIVMNYIPEEMPKDLIRKFAVDSTNKNPDKVDALLRELSLKMLHYFNRKKE